MAAAWYSRVRQHRRSDVHTLQDVEGGEKCFMSLRAVKGAHDMDERMSSMGQVIDIAVLASAARDEAAGSLWSLSSADLNANVLRFAAGDGVPEHVNDEVDVIMLVVSGGALVTLDGRELPMGAGQLLALPKGARRAIRADRDGVVYVTIHRRRVGLMPARAQR